MQHTKTIPAKHHESICHCHRVRVDSRRDKRCTLCTWVKCCYGDCGCNYTGRAKRKATRRR